MRENQKTKKNARFARFAESNGQNSRQTDIFAESNGQSPRQSWESSQLFLPKSQICREPGWPALGKQGLVAESYAGRLSANTGPFAESRTFRALGKQWIVAESFEKALGKYFTFAECLTLALGKQILFF